jgi:hypothetical protein
MGNLKKATEVRLRNEDSEITVAYDCVLSYLYGEFSSQVKNDKIEMELAFWKKLKGQSLNHTPTGKKIIISLYHLDYLELLGVAVRKINSLQFANNITFVLCTIEQNEIIRRFIFSYVANHQGEYIAWIPEIHKVVKKVFTEVETSGITNIFRRCHNRHVQRVHGGYVLCDDGPAQNKLKKKKIVAIRDLTQSVRSAKGMVVKQFKDDKKQLKGLEKLLKKLRGNDMLSEDLRTQIDDSLPAIERAIEIAGVYRKLL